MEAQMDWWSQEDHAQGLQQILSQCYDGWSPCLTEKTSSAQWQLAFPSVQGNNENNFTGVWWVGGLLGIAART